MKRSRVILPAIFIMLLLAAALLAGPATSKTPTPNPPTAQPWTPTDIVVGNNAISGTVYDMNGKAVPGAKVTLYYTSWTGADYKAKGIFRSDNNPQYTGDGQASSPGLYVFTGIPADVYLVTAEKEGVSVSQLVDANGGTKTKDLTLNGYTVKGTASPPAATRQPTPGATADPDLDVGALILEVLNLTLMGVVGIQFIVGIAVIVFHAGRKN